MSTIADVAARAGVSKATASRALTGRGYVSDATRSRVTEAARELSYVAHSSATSLATGRTQTIGVVLPSIERWFFAELLAGIQESLLELDYDLALYSFKEGAGQRARLFESVLPRKRFDGLIVAGIQPGPHELERVQRADHPLVTVGPPADRASSVSIDDSAAARIATEHLIELGHTRIALVGTSADAASRSFVDSRRVDGYRDAMSSAGLGSHLRVADGVEVGAGTMPDGYAAAAELLGDRRDRPTAIVGVCDEAAIGAIIASRRLGISVPAELSVVGIDDHQHAEMFALTTIRQRPREQGAQAVRLLQQRIEDPAIPVEHVVAASALVVRNSTAPAR
ncbi:LacI family DNA-binding transcriptional regulator [Microbacterium sp. LWH12-1.2]|uniref:LacI family DNA-binding transcriptional regulator n=1 Tax=Microbacterium sp. LWH12-1.2 TaxID=3135259 RepID=UPI0034326A5E